MSGNTINLHRVMQCPPERLYRAFITPEAMCKWNAPHGFVARVNEIDARVGGRYHMAFINFSTGEEHSFGGTYRELIEFEKLVYDDQFDDPAMPGQMLTSVSLRPVLNGTELHIEQSGIPEMIPVEMCYVGWQQSLELLAKLVEHEVPSQGDPA